MWTNVNITNIYRSFHHHVRFVLLYLCNYLFACMCVMMIPISIYRSSNDFSVKHNNFDRLKSLINSVIFPLFVVYSTCMQNIRIFACRTLKRNGREFCVIIFVSFSFVHVFLLRKWCVTFWLLPKQHSSSLINWKINGLNSSFSMPNYLVLIFQGITHMTIHQIPSWCPKITRLSLWSKFKYSSTYLFFCCCAPCKIDGWKWCC